MKVCTDVTFTKPSGKQVQGFYMDSNLVANLVYLKKLIANKWDGVGMLCGFPGSGKTTFSHQICYFMDRGFNLDRIVFSGQDLMFQIDKAKVGDAITFDEAVISLMSQDFSTDLQKVLIKKFTMIRSKRLFILFIIPGFFLMRKYFSVDRTRFMINCYSPDGLARGYFEFFSYNRKKKLFLMGYKENDMTCVRPNFRGRFTDTEGFFVDPEAYEAKKQAAIKAMTEEKKTKEQIFKEQFDDAKLKMKINIEQWKAKYQEKVDERFAKFKQQLAELKQKHKDDLALIKEESVGLERTRAIQKSKELERDLSKLLYFFYRIECEKFQRQTGKEYEISTYAEWLRQNNVIDKPTPKLKPLIKAGEDYAKLGI